MNKFISLGEKTGADQGMADFMRLYGFEEVNTCEAANIIIFNGGADIATELYGQVHYQSKDVIKMSTRDKEEVEVFKNFALTRGKSQTKNAKLMLGICRGAQFLNVMCGGGLWQDVNNHGRDHKIRFALGTPFSDEPDQISTSTHHQMMKPHNSAELIAYAEDIATRFNGRYKEKLTNVDPEIVWYNNRNALCIQGHPEYVPDSQFSQTCVKLINHYLAVATGRLKEVQPSVA